MAAHWRDGSYGFFEYSRELVNVGPIEYLNQCRLEHAARQLREQPELSVTDVAFANGFNSSQYFATCFRRRRFKTIAPPVSVGAMRLNGLRM